MPLRAKRKEPPKGFIYTDYQGSFLAENAKLMTWQKHTTSQKHWAGYRRREPASELPGRSLVDSNISASVGRVPTAFRAVMHAPRRTVRFGEPLTFSLGDPRGLTFADLREMPQRLLDRNGTYQEVEFQIPNSPSVLTLGFNANE